MKRGFEIKQFKEISKQILNAINLKDNFEEIKTIAGFDVSFKNNKAICVGVMLEYPSMKEIETKETVSTEEISYSPGFTVFREGPIIIETYRSFEKKPDLLVVKGNGSIHPTKFGTASYVGVLINKPCVGVVKELIFGKLVDENILFKGVVKGKALKYKEFANPVYLSPGHNISLDSAYEIMKKCGDEKYKLPYPLYLAHKYLSKLKNKKE